MYNLRKSILVSVAELERFTINSGLKSILVPCKLENEVVMINDQPRLAFYIELDFNRMFRVW